MGYYGLCVEGLRSYQDLKQIKLPSPIKLWSRKTLSSGLKAIKQSIRHLRNNHHMIIVKTLQPDVAKWSARDGRVDCIQIPLHGLNRILSPPLIKMMRLNNKKIEIIFSEIIEAFSVRNPSWLRGISKTLVNVQKNSCPIVFGSGGSEIIQLRAPRDVSSLVSSFGLEYIRTLDSFSVEPYRMIETNEKKLSGEIIAPGVNMRVVEEG